MQHLKLECKKCSYNCWKKVTYKKAFFFKGEITVWQTRNKFCILKKNQFFLNWFFPASDILSFFIFWFSMQNSYFPFTRFSETQINPDIALRLTAEKATYGVIFPYHLEDINAIIGPTFLFQITFISGWTENSSWKVFKGILNWGFLRITYYSKSDGQSDWRLNI